MSDEPLTFQAPAYCLFSIDDNAVLMTMHGNLAIFVNKQIAEEYAKTSRRRLKVVTVSIKPVTEQ